MKAQINQVVHRSVGDDFGHLTLELVPETNDEEELIRRISENHNQVIEKELDESVVELGAVVTSPDGIEIEIIFPKSAVCC